MKKTVFFLVVMTLLVGGAYGQDTIERPLDNWFYNCWTGDSVDLLSIRGFAVMGSDSSQFAVRMFSDEPLTVYGIAAVLSTTNLELNGVDGGNRPVYTDSNYEYLRIYYHEGDTLRMLRQARVQYSDHPDHYFIVNSPNNEFKGPCGVFESYFEKPVTVVDSFYVGMTFAQYNHRSWNHDPLSYQDNYIRLATVVYEGQIDCLRFETDCFYPNEPWHFHTQGDGGRPYYTLIFPILTPDTRPEPTGIETRSSKEGFSLSPNPASGTVTVILGRPSEGCLLELYDAAGRLVETLDMPPTATSTTFNLRHCPPGVYLLKLPSPTGNAVRKLVVR